MSKQTKKFVVDFGIRKLSNRPFTTTISIPKQALKNCSDSNFQKVSVQLVSENGEKSIKLIPVLELKKVIT